MALFVLAFLVVTSCFVFAADGAMFRGDLRHSGVYAGSGPLQFSKVKWKFRTHGYVISSPAIANGVAYFGSTDHNLYAVDLETGAQKWKFQTESRVQSSPAVSDGVVYFGSYDGFFFALNAADGSLKWKFETGGEHRFTAKHLHGASPVAEAMPDPFDLYLSSPAIWNSAVYFGSGDGNVYALDLAGKLKWKFHTGDVVHASPAIADGTLFIGSWDSNFYALDAATGAERWRFKTGEDPDIHNQVGIQSSALVAEGTVYFGCRDANFYALDAKTGQKKWAFNNKGSWVIGSPTAKDGKVYFATSDSSMFYGLDAASGKELSSLNFKKWPLFSSPAIAGNMLYVGSHEGKLMAIDLSTRKLAWTFQTDGSKQNGATYTKPDGTPNYEAAFFDFFYDDMVSGVQKMLSVGAIVSSPVIASGVIYFGSADGNLYALM